MLKTLSLVLTDDRRDAPALRAAIPFLRRAERVDIAIIDQIGRASCRERV